MLKSLSKITLLRVSVAYLGEAEQYAWWHSAFLNTTGFRYMSLIFPRTVASACVTAASEAACRVHDERIGRGHVVHLFRLPHEVEIQIRGELAVLTSEKLHIICRKDEALRKLDDLANGARPKVSAGPLQIGPARGFLDDDSIARTAAVYAVAFRAGQPSYPYFA